MFSQCCSVPALVCHSPQSTVRQKSRLNSICFNGNPEETAHSVVLQDDVGPGVSAFMHV